MSRAYFEGFEAGVDGFRAHGAHVIPSRHPHGSTEEGRDWFLGCNAALEQCSATFRGAKAPQPKEEAPSERQLTEGGLSTTTK